MDIKDYTLEVSHTETEQREALHRLLKRHNREVHYQHYHDADGNEISGETYEAYYTAADGNLMAGITTNIAWQAMYVHNLWVHPDLQGQRIGTKLMQMAEDEAQQRDLRFVWLRTFSFQARGFYEKRGYRVVGELQDWPPGQVFYTMRKDLKDEIHHV